MGSTKIWGIYLSGISPATAIHYYIPFILLITIAQIFPKNLDIKLLYQPKSQDFSLYVRFLGFCR